MIPTATGALAHLTQTVISALILFFFMKPQESVYRVVLMATLVTHPIRNARVSDLQVQPVMLTVMGVLGLPFRSALNA